MKACILIIGLFFSTLLCKAQTTVPSSSLPDITQLKQQGVDTIITYNNKIAPGRFFPLSYRDFEFNDNYSTLTFWRKNGKSFFYYQSRNMYYPVHEFVADSIWNFYTANRAVIDTETLKAPLLKQVNLETEKITTFYPKQQAMEFRRIEFYINGTKQVKIFDYLGFRQLNLIGGEENLNYYYNINTKTAQFQRLIERLFLRELKDQKAIKKPK